MESHRGLLINHLQHLLPLFPAHQGTIAHINVP
jgi:hypothetical protein